MSKKNIHSTQKDDKQEKVSFRNYLKASLIESFPANIWIMVGFCLAAGFISFAQLVTRKAMLIPMLILSLVSLIWLLLAKDAVPEDKAKDDIWYPKHKMRYVNLFMIIISLDVFCLTDTGLILTALPIPVAFSLIILFMYLIMALVLVLGKDVAFKNSLAERNIYTGESATGVHPGDVIIGQVWDRENDRPTGKDWIIPYKDRFVHMIIYGPTGSGKTSQILGPMSLQDLKNKDMGVMVLEPKGDFAEKVYARAKWLGRKDVVYFNPILPDCPYFNPLMGDETEVLENLAAAFGALDTTESSYFRNNNDELIRNCIKAVKRLYGDKADFNDILTLMNNLNNRGAMMMNELHHKVFADPLITIENENIYNYFMMKYYPGMKGAKGADKTFSDSSAVRSQVQKLVNNRYLAKVLMPPKNVELKEGDYLNFDKALEEGHVICMCSAQGALRDMGTYLGLFLILTLQSSVFKRPGNEDTRRGCALYIDEFQKYSNDSMEDLLTQGRSYRIACVFATQTRALVNSGGDKGRRFLENVSANCRNVIVFPGLNSNDAKYFEAEFGTEDVETTKESYSNRAYVPKFVGFDSARVTTSTEIKKQNRFDASFLQYAQFSKVICKSLYNNSVQPPQFLEVHYVDRSVDKASKHFLDEIMHGTSLESIEEKAKIDSDKDAVKAQETLEIGTVSDEDEDTLDVFGLYDDDLHNNHSQEDTNEEQDYSRDDTSDNSYDDQADVVNEDLNQEFEEGEELFPEE